MERPQGEFSQETSRWLSSPHGNSLWIGIEDTTGAPFQGIQDVAHGVRQGDRATQRAGDVQGRAVIEGDPCWMIEHDAGKDHQISKRPGSELDDDVLRHQQARHRDRFPQPRVHNQDHVQGRPGAGVEIPGGPGQNRRKQVASRQGRPTSGKALDLPPAQDPFHPPVVLQEIPHHPQAVLLKPEPIVSRLRGNRPPGEEIPFVRGVDETNPQATAENPLPGMHRLQHLTGFFHRVGTHAVTLEAGHPHRDHADGAHLGPEGRQIKYAALQMFPIVEARRDHDLGVHFDAVIRQPAQLGHDVGGAGIP